MLEKEKLAKEEAEKVEKYEQYMEHMMFGLCEETAMLLYPWVFKDEHGRKRDKMQSPPYTELVQDLFKQYFDVMEEARIQLNEDTIEKMFFESNVDITDELIEGALVEIREIVATIVNQLVNSNVHRYISR